MAGAFGELSPAFCELALKHLSYFACRKDHAFEMRKLSIVPLWGLTAQRGWARLILDRLDALVHDSAATTHGRASSHADDAAEHHNYFFSDRGKGTAHSAGFGWRGGGS